MSDAADKVVSDDERAMELFEAQLQRRRIAESMTPYVFNPLRTCDVCGERIPLERLKAISHCGTCAVCSAAWEAKNRSRGP